MNGPTCQGEQRNNGDQDGGDRGRFPDILGPSRMDRRAGEIICPSSLNQPRSLPGRPGTWRSEAAFGKESRR